jgi:signal transduction histidine kinase
LTNLRGIDIVWLLFLGALAALGLTQERHVPWEWAVLSALGLLQVTEGHLGWASTRGRAAAAIGVKFALCYLFIWQTGGIESSYYLILFLPVISGASMFGLAGTLLTSAVASGLYVSFLAFVIENYYVPPDGQRELAVRILFLFLMAILVNRFAIENRLKTERLSEANRDLRQAQAEVRRSERLAALGHLSAGLAHEIRNPLGVISASAELLRQRVSSENEVAREVAGFIGSEVNRTNSLVTRFLDFARPSTPHREVREINAVIERAVQTLKDSVRAGDPPLELVCQLGEVPTFSFDPMLIESSLFNLLTNAREAMADGGRILIESRSNGSNVVVTVSDSGLGIPAEEIEDIFNPFFTTKPHGVGLGLAMVSKFIDSHGGTISVASKDGQGATFTVTLPLTQERELTTR